MDTSILEFSGLLPPCSYIRIGGRAGLMDTIYPRVSIFFRENITCMTAFHAFFRSCYPILISRNATIGSLLAYSVFLYILRHTLRPSDMISYADNPFFGLLSSRTQDIPLTAYVPGSCFLISASNATCIIWPVSFHACANISDNSLFLPLRLHINRALSNPDL